MPIIQPSEVDSSRICSAFEQEDFMAREYFIEIQPLFNLGEPFRFISQECGPFDRRTTMSVPFWVALYLEKHGKCIIKEPEWLSPGLLLQKVREEREEGPGAFGQLADHMIQVALILLKRDYLSDDHLGGKANRRHIETAVNELLLIRRSKISEGLKQVDVTTTVVGTANMTSVERESIRPQTTLILDSSRDLLNIREDVIHDEVRGM
jgi:GINS complex subunit 2